MCTTIVKFILKKWLFFDDYYIGRRSHSIILNNWIYQSKIHPEKIIIFCVNLPKRKLHALNSSSVLSIIGFSCYETFEIQIITFGCNNHRVIAFRHICFFWGILQIIYDFNENVCRLICFFNIISKIRMFKRRP